MKSVITNEELKLIRDNLIANGRQPKAWMIKEEVKKMKGVTIDESTIRGRFLEMHEPLSAPVNVKKETETPKREIVKKDYQIHDELKRYVPKDDEFTNYIEREVDKRLATHYDIGKYPLTQGKQGTGKTYSHMYYAYKNGLPFFLFSGYEDFKLPKLFGDKTIQNGSIAFQESLFVKAIQNPSVILFDEINAISNANTFDFHALLQNRELYIKDANGGKGLVYDLHPDCKIGFAQNPKSAKYIGGTIKPSNFLGRCTYITYPEFTKGEIKKAIRKRYPDMVDQDIDNFTKYYFAILDIIERSGLPVDISIRQINNVIDLWMAGLPLVESIEDGLSSILEAVSQPKAKDSFFRIAQAIWKELM